MRLLFIIIFLTNSYNLLYAQNVNVFQIDSLKAVADQVSREERINVYNELSVLYRNTNTERALFYAQEALKLAKDDNNHKQIAISNINVGVVLRNFGKSEEALTYLFEALTTSIDENLNDVKANALHKISVTYLLVNDYVKALEYVKQEFDALELSQNQLSKADALNLLGLIQINSEQYKEATQNLIKSLEISYSIKDSSQIYKPLVNLGDMYLKLNKPDSALIYIKQSKKASEATGNTFGLAVALMKEGQTLKMLQQYDEAERRIRESLLIAEQLNSLSLVRNSYESLAKLFEEKNNYKNALLYYKLYISTEDSMVSEVTKTKIAALEIDHQLKQKESEIEKLHNLSDVQNYRALSLIALLILSLVLIFFLYQRIKAKREKRDSVLKLENQLKEKHESLSKTEKLLQETSEQLFKLQNTLMFDMPEYLNIFSGYFLHKYGKAKVKRNFLKFSLVDDTFYILALNCNDKDIAGLVQGIYVNTLAEKMLNNKVFITPSDLLQDVHNKLVNYKTLINDKSEGVAALALSININTKRIVYAGAGLPIYNIRHNNLHIVNPDSFILGKPIQTNSKMFSNKTFLINKQDQLFLFLESCNDGTKVFTEENIRVILSKQDTKSIKETEKALTSGLSQYIPDIDKVDDAIIFGLEI
ncbi:tetratricopeptide repeat protein [Chondrinema litorale]|uniref:tetratricopeptide repeat protein n=1 Tax=Chondrinema litorale TaxID=2994555 RepID=UPI002542FDFC|nr:hypothetical protein [Chondrinema litorale]UZR95382.1 hypothetical protein OQ292_06070 [Chondrinema litorale]